MMDYETMIELAGLVLWIAVWTWVVLRGLPRIAAWAYRPKMEYYQRMIARRAELLPSHRPRGKREDQRETRQWRYEDRPMPQECGCGGMKGHTYECAYTSNTFAPSTHRTR